MTERILIIGGPRTGKTTLARQLSTAARSTDDVMHLGWSEASQEVSTWFDEPGPWIIEGVAVVRALRKWLAAHPHVGSASRRYSYLPCDRIIYLTAAHAPLTKGMLSMTKGIESVWAEIRTELLRRGVKVEFGAPSSEVIERR